MYIRQATVKDVATIKDIASQSILAVYPQYYSAGVVEFFVLHHNEERILRDVKAGEVFLLNVDDKLVGTVTVTGNEINRLFVLPLERGHGYGEMLLSFAEERILQEHGRVYLSSSLPAEAFYFKRGYALWDERECLTDSGEVLRYKYLHKNLNNERA